METRDDDGNPASRNDARLKRALEHPVRSQIFTAVAEEPAGSLKALADQVGIPMYQLSYHYRVLARLGAVPALDSQDVASADSGV
jgi:predicted transcriptional regulator